MGVPPEKWGPYFWGVIHLGCLTGSITPEFMAMYPSVIPCGMCGQHFAELLQESPFPESKDPMVLFEWSVAVHNQVNARIGKPIMSVDQAMALWTAPVVVEPLPKVSTFDIRNAIIIFLVLLLIFMYCRK
jgi:Erv1 / Alr family